MMKPNNCIVALITGSAGGLGKEFAGRILAQGGRVCLADVKVAAGTDTQREFESSFGSGRVLFTFCDVTDPASVAAAAEAAVKHFQVNQLDVIVNNAGVLGEKEGWKTCMDVNLTGVINGCELARNGRCGDEVPQPQGATAISFFSMNKANGGRGGIVVNVASILGLFNARQPKSWAYNASKNAVVTLTR